MKNRKTRIIRNLIFNRFTPKLTRKTQSWILQNKNDAELDEAMLNVWNSIDVLDSPSTLHSLRNTKKRIGHPMFGMRRRVRQWGVVAASLAVFGMLAVSFHLYSRSAQIAEVNTVEYVVPPGQVRKITLPDGSTVSLNAGSVLIYPERFYAHSRSVYLSGEGFFNITPDKSKPFTVKTAHMDITARGTTFNVNAYPGSGKVAATLSTGEIEVKGKKENGSFNHIIAPGQQVEYDSKTGNLVRRSVDPADISGWQQGNLIFNNLSLAQIIPALERRFDVDIRVNADIDQEERYTLKFTNGETLDYVVSVLVQAAGNYKYSMDGNVVNLYSITSRNGMGKGGVRPR